MVREEGVLIEGVDRSSEYGKKGNTNIQGANASIALVFVSILQAIKWEGS